MELRLLRYQIFLAYGVAFLTVWYAALQNQKKIVDVITILPPDYTNILIKFLPFIGIIILGLYAACSVMYGVWKFADCPEAAAEIEIQIKEAKSELKRQGVKL
jgi:hypothetical protein